MKRFAWCLLVPLASSGLALSQEYPNRPIRFISNSGAGGAPDLVTRIVASKLSERLGWTTVVENRTGGNFMVGLQYVIQSPPDGYTVLHSVSSITIMPSAQKGATFDLLRDFIPITRSAGVTA